MIVLSTFLESSLNFLFNNLKKSLQNLVQSGREKPTCYFMHPVKDLPRVLKYPQKGIPTAVAPITKQMNPKIATHVEYKGFTSLPAIVSQQHHLCRSH